MTQTRAQTHIRPAVIQPQGEFLPTAPPPQSLEDERAALGAALISAKALPKLLRLTRAEDYYFAQHRHIYTAIEKLADQRQPVDVLSLPAELRRLGLLEESGGVAYVSELAETVPTAAHVDYYAEQVRECGDLRRMLELCDHVAAWCREGELKSLEIREKLLRALLEADRFGRMMGGAVDLDEAVQREVERVQEGLEKPALEMGLPTIDRLTGGVESSEVGIICGIPGSGKTAMILQWIMHSRQHWGPSALFSLEMAPNALARRLLAGETGISYQDIRRATRWNERQGKTLAFSTWELEELSRAWIKFSQLPHKCWVQHHVSTLSGIIRQSHEYYAEKGVRAVFVDYGQLVQDDSRKSAMKARHEELETVARALKSEIANPLDIPVVVLVQPSGEGIKRDGKLKMGDLKGSSEWMNVAQLILLLNKDTDYPHTNERQGVLLDIAKSRNAAKDGIPLTYLGPRFKFVLREDEGLESHMPPERSHYAQEF